MCAFNQAAPLSTALSQPPWALCLFVAVCFLFDRLLPQLAVAKLSRKKGHARKRDAFFVNTVLRSLEHCHLVSSDAQSRRLTPL